MNGVVVDTSAVVAILTQEEDWQEVLGVLESSRDRWMSAATFVELGIVLESRFGRAGADIAERFARDAGIEVVPVDIDQARDAIAAWRRFGKGRHPASLD